jgi:hypothetical protein
MKLKIRNETLVKILLLVIAVLILGAFAPQLGVTNFDRLYLKANTATGPILNVNQQGAGDIVRFQDGGTTVWSIADGGGIAATGDYTNTGRFAIDGAEDEVQLTVQGYTTQTAKTLVVETSAGTDKFTVDNSGQVIAAGTITVSAGGIDVAAGSSRISGTLNMVHNPIVNIGSTSTDFLGDGSLQTAQTITVAAGGVNVTGGSSINGALDMSNNAISNIGSASTDFLGDGSLQTAQIITVAAGGVNVTGNSTISGTLDMVHNAISNIGSTGTDFGSDGSLTTAQTVTVSAGGYNVTGNSTLNGALDMSNNAINNIGAAGTDFGADGSLITAQTITVTAGGLDVAGASDIDGALTVLTFTITYGGADIQGGSLTLEHDETIENSTDGTITATVAADGAFGVATGNLRVGSGTPSLTLNGEDAYVAGTLEADGSARFDAGAMVAGGNLEISNGLFLPMFDDLTINDGDWLTSTTVTIYALDTSSEVTMTLGACAYDGQQLELIGDDANNININYINLRNTTGAAIALTQYDVLGLRCQDSEWLQQYLSVNQ